MEGVGWEKAEYNKESEMVALFSCYSWRERKKKRNVRVRQERHIQGKGNYFIKEQASHRGLQRHKANAKATEESKCEMKASSMHHNKKKGTEMTATENIKKYKNKSGTNIKELTRDMNDMKDIKPG